MTDFVNNISANIKEDEILYIYTRKIPAIKSLIEALKEIFRDVSIKFVPKTEEIDDNGIIKIKGGMYITALNSNSNILCTVEDDGIGRKKSYSMKGTGNSNNLSMATKNTTERIELLKKINDKEYSFVIFDLEENQKSGTRVEITFPNDI